MVTQTLAQSILNYLTGKTQSIYGGSMYIGLSKKVPYINSSGEITNIDEPEISATTGYAREMIGNYQVASSQLFGTMTWDSTNNYFKITNISQIKFNKALTAWTDTTDDTTKIKAFVIYNAATGGTPLFFGELASTTHVSANQSCNIAVGAASIRIV